MSKDSRKQTGNLMPVAIMGVRKSLRNWRVEELKSKFSIMDGARSPVAGLAVFTRETASSVICSYVTYPPFTWEILLGTKIRIGNLPADADRYSLEDLLTMVGDVRTFRLEKVEDVGIAKTVAFVEMAEDSQARDCISRFNNTAFRGVTITVREDVVFVPRVRPVPTRNTKSKRRVSASR